MHLYITDQLKLMKRRIFISLCMAVLASVTIYAQTAILVRNNEPVSAFNGPDALSYAVSAAEATGDVIVLSSGYFNQCSEITKSVSIYGQGFEDASSQTYLRGKLQFRSTGEGSLDNIHLEGLNLENHLNMLNDNNRTPMNNFTVVKCLIRGLFLYMDNNNTTLRNCVIQGDLKSYPGDYKATNMLIENCWKDGGSFNRFTTDSEITIKNSIFYCRSISGFDNSSAFTNATYENSIVANCSLAANSTATNCVFVGVNASATGISTTDYVTVSSASDVLENATSFVYSAGTVPTVKSDYAGIGITAWNTTPTQPTVNFETTLVKDTDGFYKIGSVNDWLELKRVVENFNPMANAKMTTDIDLGDEQAMIGNGHYNNATFRRAFNGIFDGQGHTLTIHFVTEAIQQKLLDDNFTAPSYLGCAPFGYLYGATIRNLHTAGTITATHEGVAGIAGWTNGATLIENCHSSVDITYTDGHRGAAGITYNSHNDNHVLTIRDCIYNGTLTAGSNKTGTSGFVVHRGNGTINIYNSLQIATFENGMGSSDCATFVRNLDSNCTISNCFFITPLPTIQGSQITADELTSGKVAFYLQANREELFWGQEIGVDPQPVLTSDESKRVYRSADGYTNESTLAVDDQYLVPLNYTINSDGTLTITGFDPGFTPPDNYTLIIPDEIDGKSVSAIANNAFYQKNNFTSLSIGKNVKSIGESAFREAKGMKTLTFAAGTQLTSIATNAFRACTDLTAVVIPKTVTTMGTSIFEDCTSLTSAAYEEGFAMNYIPEWTFYNTRFSEFTIPSSVQTINKGAFMNNSALSAIEFPATLNKLGEEAFRNCSSLTQVTIPATITAMDANVLWNSGVKTADIYCEVLGQGAFYQCSQLETVNIREGVKTLGTNAGGAFHDCTKLATVTIPSTVSTIVKNLFYNCTSLTTVTFADGINLETIPEGMFYNTSLQRIDIPSSVKTIGSSAFRYCKSLTTVSFPANSQITTINNNAFADCALLPSFTMPNTVTTLSGQVFYNCPKLESITLSNLLTTIPDETFRKCSKLNNVTIPNSVTKLGTGAFRECTSLTSIIIPNSVTGMGTSLFEDCTGLTSASFQDGSTMNNLPAWTFYNTRITSFTIPASVETINKGVFMKCSALTSITIPNTVKTFADTEIFRECTSLASVTFEENSQLATIPNSTFYQSGLQEINIPSSVTTIGNSAFRYCTSLNNLVLPGTLVTIQDWAFANCTALENLTIEEGVSSINRDVFQYSGMKNVVLPSTLDVIGINLFYQCNQLEVLDLSKCINVWELYNYTTLRNSSTIFYGVPTTTKIIMPPYTNATLGTNDEVATLAFDLQPDSEGYYLINNPSDWDKFVAYSRNNPSINGKITADLDLTQHVGKLGVGNGESYYITYKGTIDGQGHYLTINYKTGKEFTGGVFAYVEESTIKNLRVKGNVDVFHRVVGGIVGFVKTTLTMQDCESDINFTVTPSSTNMHIAGFIGQGKQGNITLTDCLYTGTITGVTSFQYAAPFLGWMESAGRITYNYCLNNGTFTNTYQNYTYALGATQSNGQSTAAVCYYRSGNNTNNEKLATATDTGQLATGQIAYRLQGGRTEQHWGQLIGRDPYPLLTKEEGTLVYRGQTYTNEYVEYAGLQKDEDDYYLIGGTVDWEEFCLLVEDFPLSNARMTADVEVMDNSIVGEATGDTGRYNGTFDGQGHTLTVHYPFVSNRYSSPFANIEGATIKNLHVDGTINSAWCHGGGLVANSWGTNTLENIWVSTDITSSVSSWDECGAFVGCMKNGTLNITNCLFTGSITASSNYNGGFIGYKDGGTSILTNCLSTGTFNYTGYGHDFTRGTTVTNCYYSGTFNGSTNNITQVTDEQLASGQITYKLQGRSDDLIWAQTLGTDEQPMLAVFLTNAQRVYRTMEGYSNDPESGALIQDGQGYYLIGSVEDWKLLAMLVNDGENDAKAKMTADINLGNDQTMIGSGTIEDNNGTGNILYQGIFDGQGHTLTINYNTTELFVAPFRHIQNATIRNLHVDGTITTTERYAGGIVAACYGNQIHSYINNCISSVDIVSNYVNTGDFYSGARTGGIAGILFYYGQLHINDCIFDGSISGETRGVLWGGFLGLPDGTVTIENSLQIGTFNCSNVISGSNGSGTFSSVFGNGYASRVNVSNSYYLNQIGNAQGTLATTATLSDGTVTTALQAGRTDEVWVQDTRTGQPILALFKKSGITTGLNILTDDDNDTWFTLEGMKLDTKPTEKGVYIRNGRKVILK